MNTVGSTGAGRRFVLDRLLTNRITKRTRLRDDHFKALFERQREGSINDI